MPEKKDNKQKEKKEGCPLCNVSGETLRRLREGKKAEKENKNKEKLIRK